MDKTICRNCGADLKEVGILMDMNSLMAWYDEKTGDFKGTINISDFDSKCPECEDYVDNYIVIETDEF